MTKRKAVVTKWFAKLEGTRVIGVSRVKARTVVPQPDSVEITEDAFNLIQEADPETEFYIEKNTLIEKHVELSYLEKRKQSYPDVGEQLGALMKAVKALAHGQDIPADAYEVISAIEQIKTDYPKKPE